MSVASRPLERPTTVANRPGRNADALTRFEAPAVLVGAALLLGGSREALPIGFALTAIAWGIRARGATSWLAARSPTDAGWLLLLVGSAIGLAASFNASAAQSRFGAIAASI